MTRLRRREDAAFNELVTRYEPAVRTAITRWASDHGWTGRDVHDDAAHVFEVAWRRLDELPARPDGDPTPWLLQLAREILLP
jgi:DNA-directed RNA polymerase specialized sigma24 family protein